MGFSFNVLIVIGGMWSGVFVSSFTVLPISMSSFENEENLFTVVKGLTFFDLLVFVDEWLRFEVFFYFCNVKTT